MKKLFLILLTLFTVTFMFAEDNSYHRESTTKNGYTIEIDGMIDDNGFIDGYAITFTYEDKYEFIVWYFDKLNEAMEHFRYLEEHSFGENQVAYWRKYSLDCDILDNVWIIYYIYPKERVKEGYIWR